MTPPPGDSWRERLARGFFSTVLRLGTPLYLLRLMRRGRAEPLYRAHLPERFGFGLDVEPGSIWVHAVSLGETRAAAPLIERLRQERPGMRLLLTHTTATGREAGQALLRPGDVQRWLPFDTPGAVRRFLQGTQPSVGVLMETEIWPNLQQAAAQAGVPMVLANARLSARSLRRGERFKWLLAPAARTLRLALAQTREDAQRLTQAGVPEVQVCGNLKFDLQPDEALLAQGRAWRAALGRPVVLMAVSREGEEAALLAQWAQIKAQAPGLSVDGSRPAGSNSSGVSLGAESTAGARPPLLVIVPRHPQRFDEVAVLVQQAGWSLARRSAWGAEGPSAQDQAADVWLGDSMREMALYYGLADVALLGGSFEPLGGQNLIEAAACGVPLLMGPHTFNFAEAATLSLEAGAARRVESLDQGVAQALSLLADAPTRTGMAAAATAFAAAHRGAAQRMAARILDLIR
ncbi:3-deoxy-D-manno-octulosonic acid transferase [Roseateles depolymerans]|uniref:3-deoxy-D-manno-octulosonic acid transferase n=1 Tax=Roseateles depolymerans TaxID=76731 RepID=A0A0U3MV05_9BURK|nr:3-deoxy-D-manno-octulosonic acid transferase [Roseateles depolymerans]ALV06819.1 Three-deoxy-D-manno-octulosonic-acid transferase domain protein [Roseateles depolymerans]REG19797.1 3-deoxy-D-manno-octulosonic-acid transferase [Roseateles depolymerans]